MANRYTPIKNASGAEIAEGVMSVEGTQEIRHLMAGLSRNNVTDVERSIFSAPDLNNFINTEFLAKGYELKFVEIVDRQADGGVFFAYIFVRTIGAI